MTGTSGVQDAREARVGLACAFSAYALWGILPIYYKLITGVSADQIVAQRIVWSVISVGAFLWIVGRWSEIAAILRVPGHVVRLALSAAVVSVNWLLFIWAVGEGRVLEVSFGYFINPLVNVAIGIALLGERLTRWQGAAVAVAATGIAVQAAELGGIPWISLTLALSFGIYAYVRKTVPVGASPGLMIEVLLLSPIAVGYLMYLSLGETVVFTHPPLQWALVAGTGAITAVPLILFAAGARRLPMKTLGVLQYVAPSIHFLLAVFAYGEALDTLRLTSFVLIWVSLAIYSVGSYRNRPAPVV